MYRAISFVVIFSIVSVMLYFHNLSGHSTAVNHEMMHQANKILIPNSQIAPTVSGSVTQDPSGAWLLEIQTEHFTFEPRKAGLKDISYNEGHAHIYVNGKKINRLYGNYYNLDNLSSGTYVIKVSLNGNNHGVLIAEGKEVAYTETIKIHKGNIKNADTQVDQHFLIYAPTASLISSKPKRLINFQNASRFFAFSL